MILHLIEDVLRNSILITGLVVIMMMMIESLNIESKGSFFSGLQKSRIGGVLVGALLGAIPGCMGGFATVSLYTHRMLSFGALIAMMIASSGDEAFVMLATIPAQSMWIISILFAVAVVVGVITDIFVKKQAKPHCNEEFALHAEDSENHHGRHLTWRRALLFVGVAIFIIALATGGLEHEHGEEGHHAEEIVGGINLLSEDWMNIMFAVLSVIVLGVLIFASDHFVEEHFWHHIVVKHLPTIFCWTFGVLLLVGVMLNYLDISQWISDNTFLMILLAVLVGIIPESGPHMLFVTLFAAGVVPVPVLLASCISQDGHASLPLLAESKSSFFKAKAINCLVALAVGLIAMLF